jgi:hypothetical protein
MLHVANGEVEQDDEPILSNMEFTDVASITFKGDDSSELDSKPFVVFGSFEDGPIDEVDTRAPAVSIQPTSVYFPVQQKNSLLVARTSLKQSW